MINYILNKKGIARCLGIKDFRVRTNNLNDKEKDEAKRLIEKSASLLLQDSYKLVKESNSDSDSNYHNTDI